MGPPNVAPKGASVCTDLTAVDLTPFDSLPNPKDLPDAAKTSQEVAGLYNEVALFQLIDGKFGNKDGKLQAEEVDKFLKKNPSKDPNANACAVLAEARLFATKIPDVVAELKKVPDTSPVDLAPFYSLPDLKKFTDLPDTQDVDVLKAQIQSSGIAPEIKKLLLTDENVLARYFNAKGYVKADVDGDGKISANDITALKKANGIDETDPNFSAAVILGEARQMAPQTALFGSQVRRLYSLRNDSNSIDLTWVIGLAQIAPSFLESDPRLNLLLQSVATKNDKGQYALTTEAQDLVLTKEEFLKNPNASLMKTTLKYATDEALFAGLKDLEETLEMPFFLWPKDLQDKLKNAGTEVMEQVTQMQAINDDQRRAELILGFLDTVSKGKFDQEKVDHAGSEGGFLHGVSYVFSLGGRLFTPYKTYFQDERPKNHRETRDAAIEALRTTLREKRLSKVEDAIAYMEANGQSDKVSTLKSECDIESWVKVANTQDENERAKLLQQAAKNYREGSYKFWEFPIIPLPRLGSGGFFNRALSASNWTWKSPELPVVLSIDNFLATKTPNNWHLTHEAGSPFLLTQMSEDDRKAFNEATEKAKKGEKIDVPAMETLLSKSPLTSQGQETLKTILKGAITSGENAKVVQEFTQQAFVKKLIEDKKQEVLTRIDGLFGAVAGGIITADKAGGEIQQLYLEEADAKALKEYLGRIQTNNPAQEPMGIDVLFRESQMGDKEARARELFGKAIQTPDDKKEFNDIVNSSKLSDDNKKILSVAYDQQPMTIAFADPAEKEFLDILGQPYKNPMTGDFDPKSVGNFHNAFRTTVDRGVGVAMLGGPVLAGGGIGYSLAKATPWKAGLGGAVGGGAMGYILSEGKDGKTRVAYTAIGAGVGASVCYGVAKLFGAKGFNPWWGAAAGSMLGSLIYISPGGQKWASQSWDVMQMPYRPWSDLAVMNAPGEFTNMYMDFYVGSKGMEGILGGAKMFGALGLGEKIGGLLKVTPQTIKVGTGALVGSGMGYLTSDAKEGRTGRNMVIGGILMGTLGLKSKWPFGAALGGTIGYAGSDHKDWKTDVRRSVTGAFIGGSIFYWGGKLFKGKNIFGATNEEVGPWVKEQMGMLETQIAKEKAALAMGQGEGAAFKFSQEVVAAKEASILRLQELEKAYKTLGEANNHLSIQILGNSKKAFAEAEALMAGKIPATLSAAEVNALQAGQIEIAALGEAKLVQAETMVLSGSNELLIQNRMLLSNGRLSRLLLMGVVANKVDEKKEKTNKPPLIPPFNDNFQGNPRPKPDGNF